MIIAAPLLAVALLGAAQTQDPVRVWSSLASQEIAVGETTVLELHVETSGAAPDAIDIPTLPTGLEVVGTRDYSQLQFSLPGGRTRILRRQLVLQARAPGRYRIPPVTVRVQGMTYTTQALPLSVVGRPAGGGSIAPGIATSGTDGEVLFRAEIDADTVYVNQQVTLRSEIMISEEAQFRLRRAPEYLPPDAAGFWVHDLPGSGRASSRIVDGRIYQSQAFQRAFFPLAPGRYTLPPARLTYEMRRGFFYAPDTRELASDSFKVVVLPVPEAGKPPSFTGAVGRFELRARVEPADVPAGEAAALVVEVEGEGNIESLPPPRIPSIPGLEVYPPSENAQVDVSGGVVSGVKRFTWVLVPKETGRIEIPGIEYGYFDPVTRSYDVASSAPLALHVRPGATTPVVSAASSIRPPKDAPGGEGRLSWVRSPAFALLQLLPVVGAISVLVLRRKRRPVRPSSAALRRRCLRQLQALRSRAGRPDDDAFLDELDALLRGWVAERLASPALRKATPPALAEALEGAGAPRAVAHAFATIVGRIDRVRFEPVRPGPAARRALLEEAERTLDSVDRALPRSRRGAGAVATVIALAIAVAGAAAPRPASAAQDPRTLFDEGVRLLAERDLDAAVRAFEAYVDLRPQDPNGWYNLGNAYFEDGERGRAIWAWFRANRLAPRDPDVRHNLRVAGADPRDPTLGRRIPLSTDELLLLAGIAWLLGSGALAWTLSRRRFAAGIATAAVVILAVSLAGGRSVHDLRVDVAVVLPAIAEIRAAPDIRTEVLREVPGGSGVEIVDVRSDWMRVITADGTEGWIEAESLGSL